MRGNAGGGSRGSYSHRAWPVRAALPHLAHAAWPAGDVCQRVPKPPQGWAPSALGVVLPCWVEERRPSRRAPSLPQHDERPQSWCAPQAPACPRSRHVGAGGAGATGGDAGSVGHHDSAGVTPGPRPAGLAGRVAYGRGARMIRSQSEPRALPVRERHHETGVHRAAQGQRPHAVGCVRRPRRTLLPCGGLRASHAGGRRPLVPLDKEPVSVI